MRKRHLRWIALAAILGASFFAASGASRAEDRFITLASTTSTEQSGLFDYLIPIFTKETGLAVHVVAVGTGQAIQIGERGDADALLVHDPVAEKKFMDGGFGVDRRAVMHNDFVIIGPTADPAHIKGQPDTLEAFRRIAQAKAPFVSRGDSSGTNAMELRLWKDAGIDPKQGSGSWYREIGQGMGPTLNTAASMEGYTLSDRATWANFKNRQTLTILVERDKRLLNPYSTILVNPSRFPNVKSADAKIWHEWLTSPHGQQVIAGYKIKGEQLFFPDAKH
jgi:tungstate transport system substrate-binding protein